MNRIKSGRGKDCDGGDGAWRFGMSICYDVRFPEMYRLMTLKGAQVILFLPALRCRPGRSLGTSRFGPEPSRTVATLWRRGRLERNRLMWLMATALSQIRGDRNSTGKGCTWDHICGDRSGLSGSNQKTDSFPGKQENRICMMWRTKNHSQ